MACLEQYIEIFKMLYQSYQDESLLSAPVVLTRRSLSLPQFIMAIDKIENSEVFLTIFKKPW